MQRFAGKNKISRQDQALLTFKTFDVIDSWRSIKHFIWLNAKFYEEAANRNAKLRFITSNPEEEETIPETVSTLLKKGLIEIRHIPTCPPVTVLIKNKKEITVGISQSKNIQEAGGLYSDNPCIFTVIQDYFEMLWKKATQATG
jgi:hypothetical protein